MDKGLTWQGLTEALKEFPTRLLEAHELESVAYFVRSQRAMGRPFATGYASLWDKGWVVLEFPPLYTRFLIHKHSRPRGFLLNKPPGFILCTGKMTEDWWEIHRPSISLAGILAAIEAPIERLGNGSEGVHTLG